MPDFVYGTSYTERRRGDFPALPVVNMLAESVPTEPGVALQSRPGLKESGITWGTGPVRGVYKADNVLSDQVYGVSGNNIYSQSGIIGSISGTGTVSFAGYEDYLFANAGVEIRAYDGASLVSIPFPDDANVTKIVVGASRIVAIREDTGKIYWSDPLGININALSFATAENQPDRLFDMLYLGDRLILFGAETVEFWPSTTDADVPFAPLPGATFPVGIKGPGMAVQFKNTFAWVTNYNEVCISNPDNIISDPELQVRIAASASVSLWTFYVDDNEYLAVRIDNETWVFGARSQVWSQFESYGENNWVPHFYDSGYFGSSVDGRVLQWDNENYGDFDGPMTRLFGAWIPITSQNLTLNNIIMRNNPGTTPFLSGTYSEPTVELRSSIDGGHTWYPWKARSLGEQGQWRIKTVWSSMGQFGYPGALVQVRVTDPVPFRMSGLVYNEPFGGR